MSDAICLEPGCGSVGIFPGSRVDDDGATVHGSWCLIHPSDGVAVIAVDQAAPAADVDEGYHPDVTAGLGAMILEHTAMTTVEGVDPTGDAMRSLAKLTGMTLDVAAGILLATVAIMAAGEVSADQLTELAAIWEKIEADEQADDDDGQAVEVGPDDDRDQMATDCPTCDGTGSVELPGDNDAIGCPDCDGRGMVDPPAGPADELAAWNGDEDVPTAIVAAGGTESETN